jgi:pimeloyl-ACP methyl ester carboxylesterase
MSCRIMVEDIEQLRVHLGLERIPILFGHSRGAAIMLPYSERYQQRVVKLVLVGAQTHDSPPNDEFAQWVAKRKDDPVFGPALAAMNNARNNNPPATDEEFIKVLEQSRAY